MLVRRLIVRLLLIFSGMIMKVGYSWCGFVRIRWVMVKLVISILCKNIVMKCSKCLWWWICICFG